MLDNDSFLACFETEIIQRINVSVNLTTCDLLIITLEFYTHTQKGLDLKINLAPSLSRVNGLGTK